MATTEYDPAVPTRSALMPTADEPRVAESHDFSLALGGPLYQLFRRSHLTGDTLELLHRRILVLMSLTWVPLLLLSVAEGTAWGGRVKLTFLHDVDTHVRLLVALPLLIVAELVVNQRLRVTVRQFVEHGLVPDAARARFDAIIVSSMRLRNSITAEVLLIALVYVVGVGFVWRTQLALRVSSWYALPVDGRWQPSLAGWWMGCVSLPVFQFLLLRWYFRLFIWARALWQVSRLELALIPTHPDRSGGLGFLAQVSYAFAPLAMAQGALFAGTIARSDLLRRGRAARLQAGATRGGGRDRARRPGADARVRSEARGRQAPRPARYGTLAQRYVREFDRKWLRGGAAADEPLVGSADIQSLADLGNSFEIVQGMRLVPLTLQSVMGLALATLLPVTPLLLTMFSLDQLLGEALKILF